MYKITNNLHILMNVCTIIQIIEEKYFAVESYPFTNMNFCEAKMMVRKAKIFLRNIIQIWVEDYPCSQNGPPCIKVFSFYKFIK